MNTLKHLRPMTSQFQPFKSTQIIRSFSASPNRFYEFILTSEPAPGVGQSKYIHITFSTLNQESNDISQ